MTTIKELKGSPYTCPLSDDSSFRLLPYQTKEIEDHLVSDYMRSAEKNGVLSIGVKIPETSPVVKNHSKKKTSRK